MQEIKTELRRIEKSLTKAQKIALITAALFLPSAYISGTLVGLYRTLAPVSFFRAFGYGVFDGVGLICSVLLTVGIWAVIFISGKKNSELSREKYTDERGVTFSSAGTYGTADWLTRQEAEKVYEVGDIRDVNGIVLGQYTENGEDVIALPVKPGENCNILVLGSPGTGKTFCYVKSAIFQSMKRGESIVITDPKGELHRDMRIALQEDGYEVYVFNLIDPDKSDAWDCTGELIDPKTGNIEEARINDFCTIVMRNTMQGDKEDGFWGAGESNLFKVAVFYCAYIYEETLKTAYANATKEMLDALDVLSEDEKIQFLSAVTGQYAAMKDRRKALLALAEEELGSATLAEEYVRGIEAKGPRLNISEILYRLINNDAAKWEASFSVVDVASPAYLAWTTFKNSSDKVQPGFFTGLNNRLQLFHMRDVRRITANKDIDLSQVNQKKTAIFCVISDRSTAMRPITSLFFNFLFADIMAVADAFEPENCLPVNVLCDEFANIGEIPNFSNVIATARSRRIMISIILQGITQLWQTYTREGATSIIQCCDTTLVLGCNDDETASYVSGLSGVASIRVMSAKDDRSNSLGYRQMMQGYSVSEGDGKRMVLNPDEVRSLPKNDVFVFHNGAHILQCHRFGFISHPYFLEGRVKPISFAQLPYAHEKYKATEEEDAFIYAKIREDKANSRKEADTQRTAENRVVSKKPPVDSITLKEEVGEQGAAKHGLHTKGKLSF